jgi:hypothetical protein
MERYLNQFDKKNVSKEQSFIMNFIPKKKDLPFLSPKSSKKNMGEKIQD